MPQNNVLPDWRATYPNDAPAQKPGGVTVATTATAPRVPNKPSYSAGTIQSYDIEAAEMKFEEPPAPEITPTSELKPEESVEEGATEEEQSPHTQDEVEEADMEEAEENGEDGEPRRTTTKRTTTRTTTHRRR
jgi:hypothetical protein